MSQTSSHKKSGICLRRIHIYSSFKSLLTISESKKFYLQAVGILNFKDANLIILNWLVCKLLENNFYGKHIIDNEPNCHLRVT